MERTKFGVSVTLCAAAMYFIALFGMGALIIPAVFILFTEDDYWLKKSVLRAVGMLIAFTILTTVTGLIGNTITNSGSLLNQFIVLFRGDAMSGAFITDVNRILGIINSLVNILRPLLLLLLGFKALKRRGIKLGSVDKLLDANM